MSENIILRSWIEDFSKFLANESLKLVKSSGEPKGASTVKKLSIRFLGHYAEALVWASLNEYKEKKLTGTKAYEFTSQNFIDIRNSIQTEISTAFEAAFQKYSGQSAEYYCQIKPVPEPQNKEMC